MLANEKLIELMKEKGVTAYRVGKDIGVSVSSVLEWTHGKAHPGYKSIQKLSEYFGVPAEYFGQSEADRKKKTAFDFGKLGALIRAGRDMDFLCDEFRMEPEEIMEKIRMYGKWARMAKRSEN